MSKKEKKSTKDTEKFIRLAYWGEIKKNKLFILCPLIFMVGQISSVVIVPIFYSRFIQAATQGEISSISQIIGVASILAGLYALKSLCYFTETRVFSKTIESAQRNLAVSAFTHISTMSKTFFADRFTGSLVGQAGPYSGQIRGYVSEVIYNLLPSIVTTVLMLIYLGTKSLLLVVPLVLSAVVYAIFILKNRRKMRQLNKDAIKAGNEYSGKLADAISGIEAVKSSGTEYQEANILKQYAHTFASLRRKSTNFNNTQGEFINFLNQFFILTSVIFAVYLFINQNVELATVIIMTSYASSIIGNISSISRFKLNVQDIYSSTHEIAEIMMMEPEIKDPEHPIKLKIKEGQIEFNKASFKYTNTSEELKDDDDTPQASSRKNKKEEQHLFENLNLTIKPGEKIGLVGPSGGGKSTLLKLILRFYDVDSGEIKIDGVNVKDVVQSKLRQQIAYVPQDPALFHRSIGENIGYSKPKANQAAIELAAKQAFADEFINTLPNGYETLVGERGVKLSGGQRQRVAIARAILKDAPILLLDEATSALDSESEQFIQRSLEKLMKNRTTVVVAHRLSTIQKMDRILVVKEGRVVAQGPHDELLKISPLYKRLWSHQSGGMLKD